MQHGNTSLSNQKSFLNGINYLLKNKKPTLFYCNQYVPLLLKNFAPALGTNIKIVLNENDLPKLESVLKQFHFALGEQKIFIEKKKDYLPTTNHFLHETEENKTVFLSNIHCPISVIWVDNKHYFLKHTQKEGYLVGLNANQDKDLQKTLKTITTLMNKIEQEALLYQQTATKLKTSAMMPTHQEKQREKE